MSLSATYNQISVSWAPPTSYLRHGNITQYVVRYTRLPTFFVDNGGGLNERNNQVSDVALHGLAFSLSVFRLTQLADAGQHVDCICGRAAHRLNHGHTDDQQL